MNFKIKQVGIRKETYIRMDERDSLLGRQEQGQGSGAGADDDENFDYADDEGRAGDEAGAASSAGYSSRSSFSVTQVVLSVIGVVVGLNIILVLSMKPLTPPSFAKSFELKFVLYGVKKWAADLAWKDVWGND